jgi:hypothetical protein
MDVIFIFLRKSRSTAMSYKTEEHAVCYIVVITKPGMKL